MRTVFLICAVVWLAACTAADASSELTSAETLSAPRLHLAAPEQTFVDSDITLSWDWNGLDEGQVYVLRLWYGDEPFQEIWTQSTSHDATSMIDSYSRDTGEFSWQVAVVNTNAEGGFESMGSEWSEVQTLQRVRRFSPTPYPTEEQSELAQMIAAQEFDSTFAMLDYLRNWIHENTDIGAELQVYEPDYSDAAQMMVAYSRGEGDAPEMYCNGMSTVMLTTLVQLGIESRIVFLYGEVPGYFTQHTVLEVFNPETQAWEVHDTSKNFYYLDTETDTPASMERLVFGDLRSIEACDGQGNCSTRAFFEDTAQYMHAFRYGFSTEIWVNPDRLDMSRRVEAFDDANFAEFLSQLSSIPAREFTFHFDSWNPPTAD